MDLEAVLLSRGQAFQMGTHLFLLGPLLYGSRSLAALLLDSHYKGSVLAWSLASRRCGGCAWLPGTVGHGHSRRDLEQKPAKVRGSCLTPRWEPQAGPRGGPGAGGGSRGGEDLGREAPRSFVARSSPGGRAPQPPPRAGPDFPALFTSEKTFPGPGMLRRSNQAPAPAPPTC